MNECPFHELPPGQTVWLRYEDGFPYMVSSAELLCETWHDAQAMRPVFEEMLAAALKLEL
jgi:hypothetical protein